MGILQILATTNGAGGAAVPLFDTFPTTHLGIWSLQKERTDYTGYAVRAGLAADSGATTLDIGFLADGSFDMATYSAFGTGSERIVTWYDQSSNGFDLSRAWDASLCPIIRTSSYNSKPCVYFSTGSLGNSGFTDWNDLADMNIIAVQKRNTDNTGTVWSGGTYKGGYMVAGTPQYWFVSQYYEYNTYANLTATPTLAGEVLRWKYDGGGATDLLKARYFVNEVEQAGVSGAAIANPLSHDTGFYAPGNPAGAGGQDTELFGLYYIGQDVLDATVLQLKAGFKSRWFNFTDSNIICEGDSLTYGAGLAIKYPTRLQTLLESQTSTTWNLINDGTPAERLSVEIISQLPSRILIYQDKYKRNDILVIWAGTNDLGTSVSVTDTVNAAVSYCTDAHAKGFDVYFPNMLPRNYTLGETNPNIEADRVSFNSQLVSALAGIATVVDVATLLPDYTDTTYYDADQLHINDAGAAVIAQAVLDAITPNLN